MIREGVRAGFVEEPTMWTAWFLAPYSYLCWRKAKRQARRPGGITAFEWMRRKGLYDYACYRIQKERNR